MICFVNVDAFMLQKHTNNFYMTPKGCLMKSSLLINIYFVYVNAFFQQKKSNYFNMSLIRCPDQWSVIDTTCNVDIYSIAIIKDELHPRKIATL